MHYYHDSEIHKLKNYSGVYIRVGYFIEDLDKEYSYWILLIFYFLFVIIVHVYSLIDLFKCFRYTRTSSSNQTKILSNPKYTI